MNIRHIPRHIAASGVRIYQWTLSPDHGPLKVLRPYGYCRYHPTCSEYARRALLKHGVIKGGELAVWRIIRCNPFSQGGIDEVPE